MTSQLMITVASFPTPALALRGGADPAQVREFARHQVDAAEAARLRLAEAWTGSYQHRLAALQNIHAGLVQWRYELARTAPGRLGHGLAFNPERFRTSLVDGGPNADRLGEVGRLREGAVWDPATRRYAGGTTTPASDVLADYGRRALVRMDAVDWLPNPDVLLNVVDVNDELVPGNKLVRGAAAAKVAAQLVARVADRGGDTSRLEIGGDLLYVVTADPADADRLFAAALRRLASTADAPAAARLRAWQDARYLLYQAPRSKKGSDAVTRSFLVATGAVLLGTVPMLDHDVDLRCLVLDQANATVLPADARVFPR